MHEKRKKMLKENKKHVRKKCRGSNHQGGAILP